MKYYQPPLFYLGILGLVLSPFAGYGFYAMLITGAMFLLLDLVIRKLPMPLWAMLVVQGLVVVNWLFWGIRAIGDLIVWIDASLR